MSICQSRTPYDQELLPNLTQATSEELQVGSNNDDEAIQGKLAEHKRHKAKAQEEAQLAEEAWLEAERQEQAQLEEERAHAEAEAQRIEAACKAEEARKAEESHKKKCLVCNQCNKLKECCQWPVKGETGLGASPVGDKGKRKVDVMSPHMGEKKKRSRHPSAKVLKGTGDKEDNVEEGPSMKKTSAEARAGTVTSDQMECLIKAVEHVADNMVSLTVAQREVSRNFYWFAWSYKTYVEEHFEFLALDVPSDWDTTDEEDRDIEGLDEELEGLRREEEESQSWSESGGQTSASSAGSQV
ncbi:hypothetical protein M404DRAFT_20336 [Pisolithus tinctorius Marx 270]|uniref:Uncharacterized protein n=1 Tax=Pisolithus tinctorius Marx 270 TaxID=870435 RepID=A0A0C3JRC2_PISTI|nr:hypothetical protein M404DRAFT_20336 [Pisolithus tinctorius Marx 270]